MVTSNLTATDDLARGRIVAANYSSDSQMVSSGVSWGAIVAGAVAAAALSLILLMLGVGLGLSSVSPWAPHGIGATTIGLSTILWLTFTQLLASGMGGYLAGRLRTKWVGIHTDEIYFRDTAHGFLAWATASLATAALLTSVVGTIISGGASLAGDLATTATGAAVGGATARPGMAKAASDSGPMGYFVDSLFRRNSDATDANSAPAVNATSDSASVQTVAPTTSEITRIFSNGMRTGTLTEDDIRHVGQIVAQQTGLPQQEAEKRVSDTFKRVQGTFQEAETAAKAAIDETRKASAYAALWLFISLLIGAFIASLAATYGGRQRDI